MLELEVELTEKRNVASMMREHLPNKTAKQIRDKRATPSYKRKREVVLAPYLLPKIDETEEADEEDEVMNVPEEYDELPIAPGDPPHPEKYVLAEEGDIESHENEAWASLQEAAWREGIVRAVMNIEGPDAIPADVAACVRLLKGVLAEILLAKGQLPEAIDMEDIDGQVEEYFAKKVMEARSRTNNSKKKRKKCKKAFRYARTPLRATGKIQAFWLNM